MFRKSGSRVKQISWILAKLILEQQFKVFFEKNKSGFRKRQMFPYEHEMILLRLKPTEKSPVQLQLLLFCILFDSKSYCADRSL